RQKPAEMRRTRLGKKDHENKDGQKGPENRHVLCERQLPLVDRITDFLLRGVFCFTVLVRIVSHGTIRRDVMTNVSGRDALGRPVGLPVRSSYAAALRIDGSSIAPVAASPIAVAAIRLRAFATSAGVAASDSSDSSDSIMRR